MTAHSALSNCCFQVELISALTWDYPWLGPWRGLGQTVLRAMASGLTLHEALNQTGLAPVRFVRPSALPLGQAYESFIFQTRSVPTRENVHDFFNALCWMQFPCTKQKLNQLQATEIARTGVRPVRGAVRDALTVLDENGAFLLAPEPLWQALAQRDWRTLFIDLRPLWAQAQLLLFGHALLEKLNHPRKPMTAHIYQCPFAINSIANLDACVAQEISAERLRHKPFLPLPILGVPDWWSDNENFSFYDDPTVFRARTSGQL